jgi:hypothetical protein
MGQLKPALRAITLSIVLLGLSIQSLSASELTDAESTADQLRQSLESDTQLLNVTLRGYELNAFNCVQQYRSETSPEAVAIRNDCQTALDRTQADIFTVTRRAAATQSQLTSLRALIEKLKSTPPPTPTPPPTVPQSVDSIPSGANVGSELATPAQSIPIAPTSVIEKEEPTPSVSSKAPIAPSPEPRISNLPTTKPKATKSAKPKPQQRTINCVKGKSLKKVTGVNPKCPAGYKKK